MQWERTALKNRASRLSESARALIDAKLQSLSDEQKVAQLIQAELASVTPDDVLEFGLGSILNGGGVFPHSNKYARSKDWHALASEFHSAALKSASGIPLLWGTDAVHGHNNVFGMTLYPHNIGLGSANDPDLLRRIGECTAQDVLDTGLDWVFAPTLAVPHDFRWGRTYEGYSQEPAIVAKLGTALIQGLQGDVDSSEFLNDSHVLATSKHFVGEGATVDGMDQGNTVCSERELREVHAFGHIEALNHGAQIVMAAFNSWHGAKVHGHRYLLQEVLKERLRFDGFVVSDWDGFAQLNADLSIACADAINAGVDMLMVSSDWRQVYEAIIQSIEEERISRARLDDAVRRILNVKAMKKPSEFGIESNSETWISREEERDGSQKRKLAREAVRKSLVLLKNHNRVLPLQRNQKVLVVGAAAHDVGKQCGGWTLTWQGTGNSNEDFPNAFSIASGIEQVVSEAGGEVQFVADQIEDVVDVDVAIVVFGEDPYAEGEGDLNHLSFSAAQEQPLQQMQLLQERNIPVVALFLTGRPRWINPELNAADAFVVCWLPGCQGGAITDVIFSNEANQVNQDFQGRLSFAWPLDSMLTGISSLVERSSAYFPVGYGLNYESEMCTIQLPEDDGTEGPAQRGPTYQGSYNYPK